MGIARLPAATKAGVRSYLLSWARSCITSTSKWRKKPGKSSSSIGKMLRGGSDSPALTVFWLQSVGKRNEKNNFEKVCWSSRFFKEFCTLGSCSTLLEEHRNVSPSNTWPSHSAVVVGRVQAGFSKLQSLSLFGFERQFLLSLS